MKEEIVFNNKHEQFRKPTAYQLIKLNINVYVDRQLFA